MRIAVTTLLFFVVTGLAGAGDVPSRQYIIAGKLVDETVLSNAYQKVSGKYVVDQTSREILPAGHRQASRISGKVVDIASDRRLILDTGKTLLAVQCRDIGSAREGDDVSVLVRRSGVPNFSYEAKSDSRRSLPQYIDVTMSFSDFVTALQRGKYFAELPELGLSEGKKGGFRTRRVHKNKVEDR